MTIEGSPVVSVVAGEDSVITCHAVGGKPAPNITWESLGESIDEGVSFSTAVQPDGKREDSTGHLTIRAVKADRERQFTCHAINAAMINTKRAQVSLEVLCE